MEVLSRMLNSPPQNFQFHQFCEKVRLTHLTFVDDLMIFCTADNHSISFIKETIKRFGELSGLFANLAKSSNFLVGVNSSKASWLAPNMDFSIGHLPVRYLGLPLLSGRLRSSDCDPLIQRITSHIRSWSARVLSFAGKEEGRGGAKVAWDEVCLPFDEGGLDIRDGSSWNIASTLKILWLLLVKSGSLWVAWVESYILKGDRCGDQCWGGSILERNHRLHGGAVRELMVVFQLIRSCIKARAASWSDGVHGLI
ncbi:uncharacterized protein LOC116406188 [Cucumis sativus]|uniref:uncharacterized protein LOC116406188 n=1 Tax=Cucumis sativus TaxID=3659 RepID=UPI0012F4D241|nr:uncharacterized protein LOC116406188 [Cucumis sativus]